MKKKWIGMFLAVGVLFLGFAGTVFAAEIVVEEEVEKDFVLGKEFARVSDNFIVFFNSASSMNKKLPGSDMTRIQMAKQLLKQANDGLPDLGYKAGLYLSPL